MNADTTWTSVPNWYWRSFEVCIGVVAACIPALRPGYKTISAGITTYLSHRSSGKNSTSAPVNNGNPPSTTQGQKSTAQLKHDQAFGAAARSVSIEADRAQAYGAGEDDFAMNYLPGDKKTATQGIKKTTRIDVGATGRNGSPRSLDLGDVEGGLGNRDFV